ncbi:hypothetical protein GALMADRAFT_1060953 [Galerina marginata CBS 339.88]|uniref:N-acetyltransferase domain-containing protein n=1 Tax=Galerina marginata (strain CBS 339.88) TaxID=685588 RepID=A0A067SLV7_GALM3|nr:hypothetical protein GALMADRAFT_1060953 [Galerina marginata CBS 339.88]
MTMINSYKPTDLANVDISFKDPYDINSKIPVPPLLESERVQVVPFIPAIHGEVFYNEHAKHPSLGEYLPIHWTTYENFLAFIELLFRQDPDSVLFAIIDKTQPPSSDPEGANIPHGRIAGIIGWLHGSPHTRSLEIGPVVILPAFQRTHVSTNAIGLLLRYALDRPGQGGLGYRRVAWCADPRNEASLKAAEKMGFVREGVLRWTWELPVGKEGKEVDSAGGGRGAGRGRDSAVLSLCWDEWEGGTRDAVLERMARV